MTRLVFGSSPEFGSSQNRYLGSSTIARAIATRFCWPPEISDGIKCHTRSGISTRRRQNSARACISAGVCRLNISIGNITFSITVIESNSAEPWNSIPTSRCNSRISRSFIFARSRPSYRICPLSTACRPIRLFISTVLPEPD